MDYKNFTFADLQTEIRKISVDIKVMFTPYNENNLRDNKTILKIYRVQISPGFFCPGSWIKIIN